MHSLLEAYLKNVATHLSALPTARRTEEIREVRTHLENAVSAGQKTGQTEDEAAHVALSQFGPPGETGENLVRVCRRERAREWRGFLGAALLAAALTFFLAGWPVHWAESYFSAFTGLSAFQRVELEMGLVLPVSYYLCGGLCSAAFPKWGVRGTAFSEAALMVLFVGSNLSTLPQLFAPHPAYAFVMMVQWVVSPLAAVLGAWTLKRWQAARVHA